MSVEDDLGMLFTCFYQEGKHLERCTSFESICEKAPGLKKIWEDYKEAKETARIIFEHKFEKLMEKYDDEH